MAGHRLPPDVRPQFKDLSSRVAELERRTAGGATPLPLTLGAHFTAVAPSVGYPAQYTVEQGRFYTYGYVVGDASAVGQTITTFPLGPSSPMRFVVQAGASGAQEAAHLRLDVSGVLVYSRGPASTFISLDQISFRPGI